jgi:hypothetical protein
MYAIIVIYILYVRVSQSRSPLLAMSMASGADVVLEHVRVQVEPERVLRHIRSEFVGRGL